MRPELSVGDLTRALAALGPMDDETLKIAREMLGIDVQTTTPHHPRRAAERSVAPALPPRESRGGSRAAAEDSSAPPASPSEAAGDVQPGSLRELTPSHVVEPAWRGQIRPMQPPARRSRQAPEPLIAPPRRRAAIGALLARWTADGPPDLERILDRLLRLRPLLNLPRLRIPTLRGGVQVLIDVSPAMAPYHDDCEELVSSIQELVSPDRIELVRFSRSPLRGADDGDEPPWRPPTAGTPVVVLTDLGIGGPLFDPDRATLAEWLDFADATLRADVAVLALVPFGPARWPREIRRVLRIMHWDPRTTVSTIRRAARAAG